MASAQSDRAYLQSCFQRAPPNRGVALTKSFLPTAEKCPVCMVNIHLTHMVLVRRLLMVKVAPAWLKARYRASPGFSKIICDYLEETL
jgi:hypothetical protein